MKKILLSATVLLLAMQSVFACGGINMPAYAGEIRYFFSAAPKGQEKDITNPLNCRVVITLYFDVEETILTDSIFVNWHDGHSSIIFANKIERDTGKAIGFAGLKSFYQHVYEGNHVYDSVPAEGFCTISVDGQFRQAFTSNISNGLNNNTPFYIEARAVPDTTEGFVNSSPLMLPPSMKYGSAKNAFYVNPLVTDEQGDSLTFTLIPPLQSAGVSVPQYYYLDQFCNNYPDMNSTCTINPETGEISWQTPCYQGIFAMATMVNEYRDGKWLGSTIRDQNLYIGSKVITDVIDNEEETYITLYPNPVGNQLMGTSAANATLEVISVNGQVLVTDKANNQGTYNIEVSAIPAGLYLLRVTVDGKYINRTFTKS